MAAIWTAYDGRSWPPSACRWAMCRSIRPSEDTARHGDPNKLDPEILFELIERQWADGIGFMAIHCGINLYTIERLARQGYRYGGLVCKGGASMVAWMEATSEENPLYAQFDRVVAIEEIRCGPVAGKRPEGRVHRRFVRPGHDSGTLDQLRIGRRRPPDGLSDDGGGPWACPFGRDRSQHHSAKAHERLRAVLHAGAPCRQTSVPGTIMWSPPSEPPSPHAMART